jgi:hypothetical protein
MALGDAIAFVLRRTLPPLAAPEARGLDRQLVDRWAARPICMSADVVCGVIWKVGSNTPERR